MNYTPMIAKKDHNVTIIEDSYIEGSYFLNLSLSLDNVDLSFFLDLTKNESLLKKISEYDQEAVARKNLQPYTITLNYGKNHKIDRVIKIEKDKKTGTKIVKKDFYPSHYNGTKWSKVLGDRSEWQLYASEYLPCALYKWIFWHEGEKAADYVLSKGFISTCAVGSLARDEEYLKTKIQELGLVHKGIIFVADNDKTGKDKAYKLWKIAYELGVPAIVLPIELLYPQAKKGDDFVEFVQSLPEDLPNEDIKDIIENVIADHRNELRNIIKEIITTPDSKKPLTFDENISGEEALDQARLSVTEDDLKEHSVITENELRIAIDNKEFSDFQESIIRQHNRLSKTYKNGFSNRFIEIPDLHIREIIVNFDTFFSLQKSDVQDKVKIIIPKKYCEPILRAKIINHLRKIGIKYLLDRTQTGGGKSSTISKLFDILYLDPNYKNPSNPELKESPYLTPRTQYGLYMVNGELKADPSKKIRELAEDPSEPNYLKIKDGNCHLKPVFLELQNKGYGNADNEPCKKCVRQKTCSLTPNGYKYEARNNIANMSKYRRGRLHPSQLTEDKLTSAFSDFGLVWEEVGTLKAVNELEFTESDLTYLIAKLAIANEEIISIEKRDKLIKILSYLKSIINPVMGKTLIPTQEGNKNYYGLNNDQIIENLPSVPELNLNEYGSLMDFINPLNDLPSANIETKEVNPHYVSKEYIARQRKEEEELKARLIMELIAEAQNISPNADKLLDAILEPSDQITLSTQLSTNKGKWVLGVSSFNDTWSRLAKQAKFNLFMDATITLTQVRSLFDIPDDESLVVIQNEMIELNNLQVFKINVKGLGSNDWSKESIDRAKEAINLIRNQNTDKEIAVITQKEYAKNLNTPYWYGKHDRGTNELMDFDGIIFVGTPFINIGAVQREYNVLFCGNNSKEKPTFEQYYMQKIYELRMQGLGRSRAQYKSKTIHQFYVTTNEDLSYVKDLGVEYKEISGEAISLSLGTKSDRTIFKIQKEALSLIKEGIKVTCQTVADSLNMTKQGVSKAVKGLGLSWRDFVSCQLRLLERYKGKVDKINDLHWSEYYLKENPQEFITMSIDAIGQNGIEGLFEMIEGLKMPYHIASCFLWIISPLFDARLGKIPMILSET